MTPGEVLGELDRRGIRLFIKDGFLRYRAPHGAYTDEIRALVRAHRQTFIHEWRCISCERIVDALFGFPPVVVCRDCLGRI